MEKILTILLFSLTAIACQTEREEGQGTQTKRIDQKFLTVPFDTAKVIADLEISEAVTRLYLVDQDPKTGLKGRLDTIELMYIAFACDCQDWVDPIEHKRAQEDNFGGKDDTVKDSYEFILDKYGYYIEPAEKELEIIWNAQVSGNIVQFIGKEYNDIGYPDNAGFMDPSPPKGKVFRYYSYKLQKPYRVWGPRVFEGIDDVTGDTLFAPNVLTVNE